MIDGGPTTPRYADDADRSIAALDQAFFRDDALHRVDSLSQFAQSAWRSLMIVNGGAIVALFTLIGQTGANVDPGKLWWAFGLYVTGIAATLFSNLGAYICQSAFLTQSTNAAWNAQERMHGRPDQWDPDKGYRIGSRWEYVALGGAVVSLVCFVTGSGVAMCAVLIRLPS